MATKIQQNYLDPENLNNLFYGQLLYLCEHGQLIFLTKNPKNLGTVVATFNGKWEFNNNSASLNEITSNKIIYKQL